MSCLKNENKFNTCGLLEMGVFSAKGVQSCHIAIFLFLICQPWNYQSANANGISIF